MPSTPNQEPSVCNTGQEKFFTHHETPRDKYEIATAIIGPQSVHIANGVEGKAEIPVASNELEKEIQDEARVSPKVTEKPDNSDSLPSQKVFGESTGDDSLKVKEGDGDDDQYPTPIRLTFLTFGLMAVVLMVALDNYILGMLSHDFSILGVYCQFAY